MEIKENDEYIERKRFLMASEAQGNLSLLNMTQEEFEKEMKDLEAKIFFNIEKRMKTELSKLAKERINQNKFEGMTSLEMRKEMAKYLINLLRGIIDENTLKGIFRQAYKILKREIYGKK